MKSIVSSLVTSLALVLSANAAEVNVKISKVHLCCDGCVAGVEKAVATVPNVTVTADKGTGTVGLRGSDLATVQKAADALVEAGYFGQSDSRRVKMNNRTGAKGQKVPSLQVKGVHLCCGKCVKAVDEAVKSVAGVQSHTAAKGVKSFEVTGNFNDQEVFAALQKAGLAGRVQK